MMMLFFTLLSLAFIFICLNHPISMGITIIVQTIVVSMITGLTLGSFWFSYIILITMLSGMLVLFIYMASVASNEKFYTSLKLISISLILILLGLTTELLTETTNMELMKILTNLKTEELSLNSLFNMKYKFIILTMVIYLFMAMVTVSLIVNISEGPLRINKK
nr:NADH dehydrogenase subunit 6 [Leptocoris augur]